MIVQVFPSRDLHKSIKVFSDILVYGAQILFFYLVKYLDFFEIKILMILCASGAPSQGRDVQLVNFISVRDVMLSNG
jgi:hypothetical protein